MSFSERYIDVQTQEILTKAIPEVLSVIASTRNMLQSSWSGKLE